MEGCLGVDIYLYRAGIMRTGEEIVQGGMISVRDNSFNSLNDMRRYVWIAESVLCLADACFFLAILGCFVAKWDIANQSCHFRLIE